MSEVSDIEGKTLIEVSIIGVVEVTRIEQQGQTLGVVVYEECKSAANLALALYFLACGVAQGVAGLEPLFVIGSSFLQARSGDRREIVHIN